MAQNERDTDRKPTVSTLSIGLKQGLHTTLEAKGVVARLVGLLKRRRRWRADPVEAVAKEIWPPRGKPPETTSTPEALRRLGNELDSRNIAASPDTQKRVIDRR